MNKNITKQIIILLVAMGFAAFAGLELRGLINAEDNPTPVVGQSVEPQPAPTGPPCFEVKHQDPQMITYMQELGLDYKCVNLMYAPDPVQPEAFGSMTNTNYLYLNPKTPKSEINKILSHEYMHYARAVNIREAETFDPYMRELLNSDRALFNRMAPYRNGSSCTTDRCASLENETMAVACTELSDNRLRADFIAFCDKYLPKR